jgi:hypothetical protein
VPFIHRILAAAFLLRALSGALSAQEVRLKLDEPRLRMSVPGESSGPAMRLEATPFTAWLDFQRLAANRWIPGDLPDWLDPVVAATVTAPDGVTTTTYRLRLLGLDGPGRELQLRLFFDDQVGLAPTIAARAEDGTVRFECGPFGEGLGLSTSEMLIFPMEGVDSVEIIVPGDGSNVRGVLLALLAPQQIHRGVDFADAAEVADVFGNLPPLTTKAADFALYGRVKAVIDAGGVKLAPDAARRGTWEFSLEAPPLLAIVTYEVLNGDGLAPLECILNDRPLGASSVHWPDLADPGYLGLARPLEKDLRFLYTGWLRAQKVIPGSALRTGVNTLVLQLHPDSGPLAVRAVELQLKYNWKNLDYRLAPSTP